MYVILNTLTKPQLEEYTELRQRYVDQPFLENISHLCDIQ